MAPPMGTQPGRKPGIGLTLSGGGFRATLFHIGALWRINELGLFPELREITSVSGGSIMAAFLGLRWSRLHFKGQVARNFEDEVAAPLRRFCSTTIDIPTVLKGWLNPFRHPSDVLAARYRESLFGDATLQDLPDSADGPVFTLYATSLQTGSSVRLSRKRLADYRVGRNPQSDGADSDRRGGVERLPAGVRTADAQDRPGRVAAVHDGRCRPVRPDRIPRDAVSRRRRHLRQHGSRAHLGSLRDGAHERCGLTVRAAVGARAPGVQPDRPSAPDPEHHRPAVAALRRRRLMRDFRRGDMRGTFWRLETAIDQYRTALDGKPAPMTRTTTRHGRWPAFEPRLNRFVDRDQGALINWGYAPGRRSAGTLCDRRGRTRRSGGPWRSMGWTDWRGDMVRRGTRQVTCLSDPRPPLPQTAPCGRRRGRDSSRNAPAERGGGGRRLFSRRPRLPPRGDCRLGSREGQGARRHAFRAARGRPDHVGICARRRARARLRTRCLRDRLVYSREPVRHRAEDAGLIEAPKCSADR